MKRLITVLFALAVVFFPVTLRAFINENRDFQVWIFDSIAHKLSDRNTLFFQGEIRFGDDASNIYLGYGEILFKHQFTKRVSLIPAYRQQWVRGNEFQKFRYSYIPFFDLIVKFEGKRYSISNRSRTEYSVHDRRANTWIYRDQIYLTTVEGIGKMEVYPFVFDEIFFVERIGFEQNRLAVGISWEPIEDVNPRLFYMIRHRKDLVRGWEYQNVLGIFLFLKF